jgi:flagellar basal-body rod protein FlgF
MQNIVLVGLSRQMALARELDVVANNIANINTTGFKADGSLFQEYLSSAATADQTGGQVSFVSDVGTWHNMSQGTIEKTDNPLNIAVDGKGFLVVQTPAGERYTRNGALQINPTGQLVTSDGNPVMGDAGPIVLQPTDNQIQIARDGTISVREGNATVSSLRGKLRLVSFDKPQQLQKDGGSTFMAPADVQPQQDLKSSVVQGAIERSNVQGVVEMTRMIEITRAYTQIAAMLQQQGNLDQTSLDKLADVPAAA